ncbi:MAG TPA: NAD-glutamate dehydrogenase, partial [Gammaproteobacteria bacterium]|nr:NAD-glutamate dehydrogenase [Gammaproteobacteria bacterium]
MALRADHERQTIIDLILTFFQKRLPKGQAVLLETFAQRFLSACAVEDLRERSIDDLCGALLSQWNHIYQRKPGESKVKVFNPYLETDHWQSPHTIVEISHDDIPFLVDSARMELDRLGYQVHFVIHIGGLKVRRDAHDRITDILPTGATNKEATTEAPIYIEIDRIIDNTALEELALNIEHVLGDVRLAVADWRNMIAKMEESINELENNPPPLDTDDIAESKAFLRWLIGNNFSFLGCRDYKLIGNGVNRALQMIPGSGLGVLRDKAGGRAARRYAELPPQARKIALSKHILIIAKTHTKSTIHHPGYTDYIGVKRFNEKGELIGERRFIGLYTSSAYHSNTRGIPFVRHKVAKILQDLRFPPDSHDGKEVVHILETLPRDDLFQGSHEELMELTLGIVQLQERKRIRLFVRPDAYGRYFSCLVYVPREIFTTDLSNTMQEVLMRAFGGIESTYTTYFSDSVLARIHYNVRVDQKSRPQVDVSELEQQLVAAARSWADELKARLIQTFGEADGLRYFVKYNKAFPASYTESCSPLIAVEDIRKIETLSPEQPLGMSFIKDSERGAEILRFKLFHIEQIIVLSDVLPTLEHMGLRVLAERPHEIKLKESRRTIWINDFDMIYVSPKEIDIEKISDIFQEAFVRIWNHSIEDDGFNRLVFEAQLHWKEIVVLRAYTKYLRQIGFMFSQNYIEQALITNATIASDLIKLFKLRFSPLHTSQERPQQVALLISQIESALDQVASLDEDRILRRLLEVMMATIRTNYFQKQTDALGRTTDKPYLSFKFNPALISDLPLPRPVYEIFVYSPRVEGVHLRGGKAARGGIRWSDRREDFRTEVLGLMKAQQVKNALIVPVGAKGGFFPKQLPTDGDRDEIQKEAIYCYSTYIRGLLDLTDNIKGDKIIPANEVVCYDDQDTYLVVAADKGTATFSDIANSIAKEYEFWMGDAFASGGSAGYDHKKMGITARGVWVSVKRHFRELGLDPEKDQFTVMGIGDMAGDVFGNGVLLSKQMKLIGAFNNIHIFLDPNPDPLVSYEERKRLFHLTRSTWMDYNLELISKGGCVYNRSAKAIAISPEVQAALGIKADHLVPAELIRAMLKAPVDLIWNGGIGTFVKSSQETNLDVGDKLNDTIRVDGFELNARAVAEGGNLGLTQLGRIEYL